MAKATKEERRNKVIEVLNKARAMELQAIHQSDLSTPKIKDEKRSIGFKKIFLGTQTRLPALGSPSKSNAGTYGNLPASATYLPAIARNASVSKCMPYVALAGGSVSKFFL